MTNEIIFTLTAPHAIANEKVFSESKKTEIESDINRRDFTLKLSKIIADTSIAAANIFFCTTILPFLLSSCISESSDEDDKNAFEKFGDAVSLWHYSFSLNGKSVVSGTFNLSFDESIAERDEVMSAITNKLAQACIDFDNYFFSNKDAKPEEKKKKDVDSSLCDLLAQMFGSIDEDKKEDFAAFINKIAPSPCVKKEEKNEKIEDVNPIDLLYKLFEGKE